MSIVQTLVRGRALVQGFALFKPEDNDTIAYQLERHAERRPDKVFLLFSDRSYTYAEANTEINRHAYAYKLLGVDKGDVVALVMENRPEFIFHMLALHKIGAVSSLINSNGTGDVLAHAIRICEPKRVVVGSELWATFVEMREQLDSTDNVDIDMDPENPAEIDLPVFQERLVEASGDNPPESGTHQLKEQAAFIYTSGTTGMPKAAKVMHHRLFRGGRVWWGLALRYEKDAVLYCCLPLYHSNATILALSSVVSAGVTIALSRKFSRSRFWDECRRFNCTSFIYIGELCRYLMNAPPSDGDRDHNVQVVTGNGLRPDIWQEFQDRFGIKRVAEFYGATEGNCITVNFRGVVGSVGPMTPGMMLARWDEEEQTFIRGDDGFLVKAKAGENGILLGKIRPRQEFDGYQDKSASEKKVLHDAFEKGDSYFDTGDLLRVDRGRNLFFVDRLGDTFRWKGENVATFEVQEQITKWDPVDEVNVYGVQIEGTDGRAGMAALVLGDGKEFDAASFQAHVDDNLPSYARPIFVRLLAQIATTATMKMKKGDLQKQGFNPGATEDVIYFRHPEQGGYVPIDGAMYDGITSGAFRL